MLLSLFLFCSIFSCGDDVDENSNKIPLEITYLEYSQRDMRQVTAIDVGDYTDAALIPGGEIHVLGTTVAYLDRYTGRPIQTINASVTEHHPIASENVNNQWGEAKADPIMVTLWERACNQDTSLTEEERRILGTSSIPKDILERYDEAECLNLAIMK